MDRKAFLEAQAELAKPEDELGETKLSEPHKWMIELELEETKFKMAK